MADIMRRPGEPELFARDLRLAMAESEADGKALALLVMHVDDLERVEATLGYTASRQLANDLCAQIRETLRDRDLLIQVSDRKAWIVLHGVRNEGHAVLAANKFGRIAKGPFTIDTHQVKLDSIIGIAMFPEHATEPEDLVRRADLAIARAREERLPYQVYSVDSTRQMSKVWEIENDLDKAIEESEFELYYQGKIDLRTFRPCGAEALIRWNSPTRGLLSPAEFLPFAERAGKLDAITRFVLDAAQRQRCEWSDRWGQLPVSVNIPPSLLGAGQLINYINNSMRIWGARASDLILEITEEGVVRNPKESFAALARLRAEGIQVAIDDFGTGYSSMTYFKELPADELKIDKSFIQKLATDAGDRHIVRAIIDLAHTFNYRVVAEGVEREDVLRQLIELNCDVAQGFLFSRPCPQHEFMEWLEEYRSDHGQSARRPGRTPATEV